VICPKVAVPKLALGNPSATWLNRLLPSMRNVSV
jgi:hypothetical protein